MSMIAHPLPDYSRVIMHELETEVLRRTAELKRQLACRQRDRELEGLGKLPSLPEPSILRIGYARSCHHGAGLLNDGDQFCGLKVLVDRTSPNALEIICR